MRGEEEAINKELSMEPKAVKRIIADFKAFFIKVPKEKCYMGTAPAPDEYIFKKHNLSENDNLLVRETFNEDDAIEVNEYYYLRDVDGMPGIEDKDRESIYVYVFEKTDKTIPKKFP
ncbi:hypothetical protein ACFL6O_02895 [candidate division KSB1 bacterium]